ncbi:cytidine deaminase-like protein, partial [Chlamydoabsidia padenii]
MPPKESFLPRTEWPFEEVLSDEHTRSLELTQVYVTRVEPKYTNQLLKFIQNHLPPLEHLEHCKRIKRVTSPDTNELTLTTILCLCDHVNLDDLKQLAQQHDIHIDPQPLGVPHYPPKNKTQFTEWNSIWPVNYREDPRQDPKWTRQDVDLVQDHMLQLMTMTTREKGGLDVFARIVDPKTNTVLAQASDSRHLGHPLHHAVMNCIDLIASNERQNKGSKRKQQDDETLAYLCSGYDAYVTHEPCAMCAMALVHSRIARVFYSVPTETGCLGTVYKIHSHSSLNHHYKAFKNLLLDDPLRTPFLNFPNPLDA